MKRLIWLGLIVTFLFAQTARAQASYERLFYFREGTKARESFYAYPAYIDIFAPQAYSLTGEGKLEGKVAQDLLDFAKKQKIRVMPLAVNKSFNRTYANNFLDDEAKQDRAILELVSEAKKFNYSGWQIDFEQMDVSYREKFSRFIAKFGKALRENNLQSSVAVIAQISERPEDYKPDLWQKVIGVYDYRALGSSVDFLSIMSYDDPDSKGPIARYAWLKRVLDFTLTLVPKEKVSLGLGLYYWQWNEAGKRVGIGGQKGIGEVFDKYQVTQTYSLEHEAPYLKYQKSGKNYTIWFENKRSVAKKLELMNNLGLRGFSVWALGLEVPSVYQVIRKNS